MKRTIRLNFLVLSICFLVFTNNIYSQISVTLPTISGISGSETFASVTVGNLSGSNITSYQFRIYYDNSIVLLTGVDINGALTTSSPTVNPDTLSGRLIVAWASASPLSGSGVLLKIKVKFKNAGLTNLTTIGTNGVETFIFNSGTPTANVTNGSATTTSTTTTQYTVATTSYPTAGGTTTGGGIFNSGSNVTVTATANTGYTFTNWTEGSTVVSTSASYTFTITGSKTLVANFTANAGDNEETYVLNNIMNGFKLIERIKKTSIMSSIDINKMLSTKYNNCQKIGDYVVYTKSAQSLDPTDWAVENGTGYTGDKMPAGLTIKLAWKSDGTVYMGATGSNDDVLSSIIGGWGSIYLDNNFSGNFLETMALYTEYKNFMEKSFLSSAINLDMFSTVTDLETKIFNLFSKKIYRISSAIFLQSSPATSIYDAMKVWCPLNGLGTGTATRSFSLSYTGQINSHVLSTAANDNGNSSYIKIDGATVVQKSKWGDDYDRKNGVYPSSIEMGTTIVWSSGVPRFNMAVVCDDVTSNNHNQTPVGGLSNNRPPIISSIPIYNGSITSQYTVTTTSNPTEGGATTGSGTYNSGSSVTVVATPNSGYTFSNWTESGSIVSTSASYTFTISGNKNLAANFQLQSSTNSSIKPISSSSTVAKGSEFWIEVKVGDPNAVSNLFGISFKLASNNSNCTYVDGSAENVGFLGTGSSVLLFPQRVNDQTVDIGLSKISGSGVNGSGTIARAKFTTSSNITSGQTITFSLSDISATNATGQTIAFSSSTLSITISSTVDVWPGDCNNDKIINSSDIIRIGLYYGQTKPGSNNPGSTWKAYAREPWSADGTAPMRIYADANGDGSINSADIIPVGLNYAKVHSRMTENNYAQETPLSKATAGATLKPMLPASVKRNTPFLVQVKIGDPTAIQNLFGISFKLQSDKSSCTYVDGSATNGGFLGTGSSVLFFPQRVNDQTVDIGLSKTSGSGISGAGIIAAAQFNSSSDQIVTFSLVDVTAMDQNGNSVLLDVQQSNITVDISSSNTIPVEYSLSQNYPNPFNPATIIQYQLPEQVFVSIKVFDIVGNEIASLVNEEKAAGRYEVKFDGSKLTSGVYFYQIKAGSFVETKKLLLMK